MTLKRALLVLVLTVLAALAGCGDQGGNPEPNILHPAASLDSTYVVTGVTVDGKPYALVDDTEFRIRFADGRVTLSAGCNTMSGAYTLDGTRLTVESLATTDMGCDQPRMDQDTWVGGLFAQPVQLTTGDQATIVSGGTVLTLTDREKASPDKPLLGTKWELDTIIEGDAASSVPAGGDGTLKIDPVNADFSHYYANVACGSSSGGKAVITGDEITFAPNVGGVADCVPGEGEDSETFYAGPQAVEKAFQAVLHDTATFSIEENRLTVTNGDHALGFTAKN